MDVQDSLARGLAAAMLLAGSAFPQKQSPPQEPKPDPVWTAFETEFAATWQAYQAAVQLAQQQGTPQAQLPASPVDENWEACAAFADTGELGAIRWCIAYSESLTIPPAARNQRRHDLYRGWAKQLPEGPALLEVVRSLQMEANPNRLGSAAAVALFAEVAERVQDRRVRGEARVAMGLVLLGAGGEENQKRARESIARGIEDDPQGESVATAQGRLFQLDRLKIGLPCPDFTAKDVDGVEFKLSDYKGKVVVLDFWGFW